MESLIGFFRLDLILRQCLGGAAFFIVLILEYYPSAQIQQTLTDLAQKDINGWHLIGIVICVFLAGCFLHALQRGIFQIPIDYLRELVTESEWRNFYYPEISVELTVKRLNRLPLDKLCTELYNWGASAHSLYTVAVAMLAAKGCLVIVRFPHYCFDLRHGIPFLGFVIVLIFAGFVSDCRKCILEKQLPARPSPR